jgi:hypothetical protein
MYGTNASRQEILGGSVPVPASAQPLVTEISKQAYEGDHVAK